MRHIPVLLEEVITGLKLKPGTNAVDCTLGDAGHAEVILEKTSPDGKLLGIDADPEAVLVAKRNLYKFEDRFTAVRDNFVNLQEIVKKADFKNIGAILIDLGWSSTQFAERGRGFSWQNTDEPLDMRYGSRIERPGNNMETAADILNNYQEAELAELFHRYGEEKFSREVATAVVSSRAEQKIETVGQLVDIVLQVYRNKLKTDKEVPWVGGIHPATKVFQALRIEVNKELEVLRQALPQAVEVLDSGGRLAVISFHSLEDRIVKQYFRSQDGRSLTIINKKPIQAGADEVKVNPRARSAKLRIVEKK